MRSLSSSGTFWPGPILRRHLLLAVLALSYFLLSVVLVRLHLVKVDGDKVGTMFVRFLWLVPRMVFFVILWRLVTLTYVEKVPNRLAVLKHEIVSVVMDRERIFGAAIGFLLMTSVLVAYAQIKHLIPMMHPFSWDVAFMQLDRALHFGRLPHEYTHSLFGGHYAISFFTGLYNVWHFLLYMVLLVACFIRSENPARMQFFIAFLLTWGLGGNLLAVIFSSAGPVYYALLGHGDVYAGLLARLNDHAASGALSVVGDQALLWQWHQAENSVNTISAFPSMHVAAATLMATFAFRLSRLAGIVMTLYAVGIQIGSFHLAWHYAVDGYAGAIIAILCWHAAGLLVRRFGGLPISPAKPKAET